MGETSQGDETEWAKDTPDPALTLLTLA